MKSALVFIDHPHFQILIRPTNAWHVREPRTTCEGCPYPTHLDQIFWTENYFSRRQFTDPLVSTVLDSASISKPRLSRYLSVSTEPPPIIDTP